MTKAEVIQKAYGDYWEQIKDYVDENGFIINAISITRKINLDFERKVIRHSKDNSGMIGMCIRPTQIKGIETNNRWIKIESEDDLPKENVECFYILEIPEKYSNAGKKINIGSFKFGKNIMSQQENYFTTDNFFYHRFPFVTHYQEIIKPQPPIY
jgi:hypothetical protein